MMRFEFSIKVPELGALGKYEAADHRRVNALSRPYVDALERFAADVFPKYPSSALFMRGRLFGDGGFTVSLLCPHSIHARLGELLQFLELCRAEFLRDLEREFGKVEEGQCA